MHKEKLSRIELIQTLVMYLLSRLPEEEIEAAFSVLSDQAECDDAPIDEIRNVIIAMAEEWRASDYGK